MLIVNSIMRSLNIILPKSINETVRPNKTVSKKYFLFKEAIFEVNKRENNVC